MINETELRYFYRLLRHGTLSSRVHCQDPNKKGPAGVLCSTLVKGEEAVVEWAKKWNRKGQCYIGRNPMHAWNKPGHFTCLTFDIDPQYDKAKGATNVQVATAIKAGRRILENYPSGYLATSGNGVLLVYQLPEDLSGHLNGTLQPAYLSLTEELKKWIEKEEPVKLDVLADDMRLLRLIGTWNVKGSAENHRIAKFLYLPQPGKADRSPIIARLKALAQPQVTSTVPAKSVSYEPWVTDALDGLPAGEKHFKIIKLAGYFGGKRIPIEITKKLILEANANAKDQPASEEDVIYRIEDVYRRIRNGTYTAEPETETHTTQTIATTFEIGNLSEASKEYLEELQARSAYRTPEIPWPFEDINKITWGFPRGAIVAMGAWTGRGKTSMAITIAEYLNSIGKSVLYFPTEMGQTEIKSRYMSVATGIPNLSLFNGQVFNSAEQKAKFDAFYPEFLKRPFFMPKKDMTRLSIYELKIGLDISKPDIVIVDFLQRLNARSVNRRREVGEFIMTLKDEVKQRNIACLVLSQFHRPDKSQSGKYFAPTIFDFAECGDIENTSDIAIILHPPLDERGFVVEQNNGERYQPVLCDIAKNRHGGRTGVVYLKVDTETTKFVEA